MAAFDYVLVPQSFLRVSKKLHEDKVLIKGVLNYISDSAVTEFGGRKLISPMLELRTNQFDGSWQTYEARKEGVYKWRTESEIKTNEEAASKISKLYNEDIPGLWDINQGNPPKVVDDVFRCFLRVPNHFLAEFIAFYSNTAFNLEDGTLANNSFYAYSVIKIDI